MTNVIEMTNEQINGTVENEINAAARRFYWHNREFHGMASNGVSVQVEPRGRLSDAEMWFSVNGDEIFHLQRNGVGDWTIWGIYDNGITANSFSIKRDLVLTALRGL